MAVNEWELAQSIGKASDWKSIPGITDFGLTVRQGASKATPEQDRYAVMLVFGHKRLMKENEQKGLKSVSVDYDGKNWDLPVYRKFVAKMEG